MSYRLAWYPRLAPTSVPWLSVTQREAMAAEAPGATDLPRTEPAEAAAEAVVEARGAEARDGAEVEQEPAKTVSLQEGSRVTTPFGGGTLKSIR